MVQVFVVNPKGGCGKTTIATQLAGYYSNNEQSVLLVDHDIQRSSSDWLSSRSTKNTNITLKNAKQGYESECANYSVVIHDMPAAFSLAKNPQLIQLGDKVIVPVLPSPTDIKACFRFIMSLERSGFMEKGHDIGIVANRVRYSTTYAHILAVFLTRLDLPLLAILRDSQNYLKAMNEGNSVFDLPAYQVRQDLAQWQPLLDWVHPLYQEEAVFI